MLARAGGAGRGKGGSRRGKVGIVLYKLSRRGDDESHNRASKKEENRLFNNNNNDRTRPFVSCSIAIEVSPTWCRVLFLELCFPCRTGKSNLPQASSVHCTFEPCPNTTSSEALQLSRQRCEQFPRAAFRIRFCRPSSVDEHIRKGRLLQSNHEGDAVLDN